MELYELNYLNLRRLIPDIEVLGESSVSVAKDGLDLYFNLLERCKYTVTFSLSYCFDDESGEVWAPDLQIRLYSDARVAEVISGVLNRRRYLHRNGARGDNFYEDVTLNAVINRWRLNRFLNRWLKFCLKQGHSFAAVYTAGQIQARIDSMMSGGGR